MEPRAATRDCALAFLVADPRAKCCRPTKSRSGREGAVSHAPIKFIATTRPPAVAWFCIVFAACVPSRSSSPTPESIARFASSEPLDAGPATRPDANSNMDAVVAPQPVGAHPLRCGERVLGVGTEWREVLESDILLHDGSSCEGAATDWLPTRDVTKRILAVDGERVAKIALRDPADAVLGGRTVVVDDDGNATEESPPTGDDWSFPPNLHTILTDPPLVTPSAPPHFP